MLTPTIRQLEVFRAVVETGSFSAAAAQLDISQPSVSTHIRALESRVGQPLFERSRGRASSLTELGQRIYDYAEEILNRSDRAFADVRSLRTEWDNTLSFTAQRYVADNLLPKVLSEFAQRHGDVEIIANITVLDHVVDQVRRRKVDLGLFLARGGVAGMQSETIGRQNLVFVAAPGHPLARRRTISLGELAKFPFAGPVRNSEYGHLLNAGFAEIGLTDYTMITQSHDSRILREMVFAGVAVYCALPLTVKADLETGRLVALDVAHDPIGLEVRAGVLPGRRVSQASRHFLDYLHELRSAHAFDN